MNNVIRDEIAPDKPIPHTLEIVARLPIRTLWTTNYDRLVERAFSSIGRPIDVISSATDLSVRVRPGAVRLFKMHGSVDRLDDIVIATDDYELYRMRRGAFLPLLQAHLASMSMLFVGLSFTDPNVRHVLSLIRESFTASPPEHYALVRPPQRTDYKSTNEYTARLNQHRLWADDLLRYGLQVVEVGKYDEVEELMHLLERQVASRRVWVSGSWPTKDLNSDRSAFVAQVAEAIGLRLADRLFTLVIGSGLTVSSALLSGFLDGLRRQASWDLEQRLIVRPFPQPVRGLAPREDQWTSLRKEMARISGAIIVIGGVKIIDGQIKRADGVRQEFEEARAAGSLLLPIGATGGEAEIIAQELIELPRRGKLRLQLPDRKLIQELLYEKNPERIAELVVAALVQTKKRSDR